MFDVGIIGGMGPMATAELFARVVAATSAGYDQEHIPMVILNDTSIPDRTKYLLNDEESPLPGILTNIDTAKALGCKFVAIPCNTSHAFAPLFEQIEDIQFINMVKETCNHAVAKFPDKNICVLATLGTYHADIYKKDVDTAPHISYPGYNNQTYVMSVINQIKNGSYDPKALAGNLCMHLEEEFDMGETVFVLACTELSLLAPYLIGTYVDSLDVLARAIVKRCGKEIRIEG